MVGAVSVLGPDSGVAAAQHAQTSHSSAHKRGEVSVSPCTPSISHWLVSHMLLHHSRLLHFTNHTCIFTQNFLALIPMALLLGDVTEDLAVRFGDMVGGLLNATFGNVVEMILSIAALRQGLYTVVAASLLGSILSNLLLVLGERHLGGFHDTQWLLCIYAHFKTSVITLCVVVHGSYTAGCCIWFYSTESSTC